MNRFLSICVLFFVTNSAFTQEIEVPVDFRQHNTILFNSSFLNPVFSLEKKAKHSFDFWARWQWQNVDADPSTLLFNYTGQIKPNSAFGVGFFQHNTGAFLQTGGTVNFAYEINLGSNASLSLGVNGYGYQQEFAQNIFIDDLGIDLPQLQIENDFIFQVAPGIMLDINNFHVSLTSENMFVFSKNESISPDKIYFGHIDYDFPIGFFNDEEAYLKPFLYVKSIPNSETQMGLGTLLKTSKFWAQIAHNDFYGISAGVGGTFFKRLSIGALIEFGTDESIENEDPSFEFVTSYNFGKKDSREKVIEFDVEDEESIEVEEESKKELKKRLKAEEAIAKAETERVKDSINNTRIDAEALAVLENLKKEQELDSIRKAEETNALAEIERQQRTDSIIKAKDDERAIAMVEVLKEEQRLDSINKVELALAEKKKKELEGIAQVKKEKKSLKTTSGWYEEVSSEGNLAPGYYLIANIFGTKRYYEAFMVDLKKKGLNPGSFFRSINKYNYVYLKRYDTLQQAEQGRDSKYNGKYPDKTWIFRVIGN